MGPNIFQHSHPDGPFFALIYSTNPIKAICVKWTNLAEELICEYGANHRLFQNPSKEKPPKVQKIRGPQRISISVEPVRSSDGDSSPPVPDTGTTDVLELHPSSGEDSEASGEDSTDRR